ARDRVPRGPVEVDARPGGPRAQPLAPRHPRRGLGASRRRVPHRVQGLDRRPGPQRRLGQRHPRHGARPQPHALRADPRRGCGAGRPARRRLPRPRARELRHGLGGERAGGGLGLHRDLRHQQRRRLPHRPLPARRQGHLGLPGHVRHLAAPARGADRVERARRARGLRAGRRPARPVESPRAGADRHEPGPGAAAGTPAAAEPRAARDHGLVGRGAGRAGGRTHRAPARARRQRRHQEPVDRLPRLLPGVRAGREVLDRRPALRPGRRRDHLLRRDGDGRLRRRPRRPHQGRREQVQDGHADLPAGAPRAALHRVRLVHRHLGRRGRRPALHERDDRLQARLPQRHRVPQAVRLHRRAGVPDPVRGADRGAHQRDRRHPQRLLLAVPAHRHLRRRHPPHRRRPDARRPRPVRDGEL
ncbi:MAG: Formamidase, partial [uncultured Actinomycetospora sp.]